MAHDERGTIVVVQQYSARVQKYFNAHIRSVYGLIYLNRFKGDTMDAEEIVLEAMKKTEKPVRPGDVVKMTDLPKEEVSKAIKNLKKMGKIMSPKRCYYAPTE